MSSLAIFQSVKQSNVTKGKKMSRHYKVEEGSFAAQQQHPVKPHAPWDISLTRCRAIAKHCLVVITSHQIGASSENRVSFDAPPTSATTVTGQTPINSEALVLLQHDTVAKPWHFSVLLCQPMPHFGCDFCVGFDTYHQDSWDFGHRSYAIIAPISGAQQTSIARNYSSLSMPFLKNAALMSLPLLTYTSPTGQFDAHPTQRTAPQPRIKAADHVAVRQSSLHVIEYVAYIMKILIHLVCR